MVTVTNECYSMEFEPLSSCKDCNSETSGKYCSNCGLKVELNRIDSQYIRHEIEHLVHFEKGFFYTIKELLIRPGRTVKVFLTTNRNRIVKPIIFIIITSLIYSLVNNYFKVEEQYYSQYDDRLNATATGKILKWVQNNYGYAGIIMGFYIAFFTKLFFRKYKYNIYEVLILICFVMGVGMLQLAVLATLQGIFKIDLMQIGSLLIMLYVSFAIADFYERKMANYLKSFAAYLIGMIVFTISALFLGVIIDIINKN